MRVAQLNSIGSWIRLSPRPEVILFGDDEGIADVCAMLGVRRIGVETSEFGTPLISDAFAQAQRAAANDVLVYSNADIVFTQSLADAAERVSARVQNFLIVGTRWDLKIDHEINFDDPEWELRLERELEANGKMGPWQAIDYLVFPKGLYASLPPFAVGRTAFDNWLVWEAERCGAAVIDVSRFVTAVHHVHDYGHVSGGSSEVFTGEEAQRNQGLVTDWSQYYSVSNAKMLLDRDGILKRARGPQYRKARRRRWWRRFVSKTRPLRHALGIRTRT